MLSQPPSIYSGLMHFFLKMQIFFQKSSLHCHCLHLALDYLSSVHHTINNCFYKKNHRYLLHSKKLKKNILYTIMQKLVMLCLTLFWRSQWFGLPSIRQIVACLFIFHLMAWNFKKITSLHFTALLFFTLFTLLRCFTFLWNSATFNG